MNEYTVFGQCRCCLKTGNHKSFTDPYSRDGILVDFRESFLACFNLILLSDKEVTENLNLICYTCTQTLNEACKFKNMVVHSEEYLRGLISRRRNDFGTEIKLGLHSEIDIKEEDGEMLLDNEHCSVESDGKGSGSLDQNGTLLPETMEEAPIEKDDSMDEVMSNLSSKNKPEEKRVETKAKAIQGSCAGSLDQNGTLLPQTMEDASLQKQDNIDKVVSKSSIYKPKEKQVETKARTNQGKETPDFLKSECCFTDFLLKRSKTSTKVLSDELLARYDAIGRACPELNIYLKNQRRRFRMELYDKYPWITGSCQLNGMFCFPCLLFATCSSSGAWDNEGYSDLRNLYVAARKHSQNVRHLKNVLILTNLRKQATPAYICVEKNRIAKRNRDLMKRFIDTVVFLAKQGLFEHVCSKNNHYVETLSFLREYDALLDLHIEQCSATENPEFSGVSSETQNDLFACIALVVKDAIKKEIRQADFVSAIIEKETVGKKMPLLLRYVSMNGVEERLLGFLDAPDKCDTTALTEQLLNVLEQYECKDKLVGLSYPFIPEENATQDRLMKECPMTVSVPCHSHSLSLLLTYSLESILEYKSFFADVNSVLRFFDRFPNCSTLLKEIVDQRIPGETFLLRSDNSRAVKTVFDHRLDMLQTCKTMLGDIESPEWDSEALLIAEGLVKKLQDMQFCFLLHVFADIFEKTYTLDGLLQSKAIEFKDAMKEINQFKSWLMETFTRRFFIIYGTVQFCESTRHSHLNCTEKRALYYQMFEEIIKIVQHHIEFTYKAFSQMPFLDLLNKMHYIRFHNIHPEEKIRALLKQFPDEFEYSPLSNELKALYSTKFLENFDALQLYLHLTSSGIRETFPETIRLCDLFLTLPVTKSEEISCTTKRQRLNVFVATGRDEGSFNDLALIYAEKDLIARLKTNTVFYDNVLGYFVKRNSKITLV
ncbi:zinc-finger associated domain (zf-AD) domain-containing protein [Phthorimaea operculella]|nr:zinc-finger associated domain (zf-AD) domain-containing protein [Phthorimaea operculella]